MRQSREQTYDMLASHPYLFPANDVSAKLYLQRLATLASALAALRTAELCLQGVRVLLLKTELCA